MSSALRCPSPNLSIRCSLASTATPEKTKPSAISSIGSSCDFGRDRVLKFEAQDTYDPGREGRLVSAENSFAKERRAAKARISWLGPEPGEPPVRPLQLFDPPQPIEPPLAEVPDGPPKRFRWRHVVHDIVRAEGPERIAPEWWRKKNDEPDRDYYRVEDALGCRFWIFRQGLYGQDAAHPRWFLHGVFA